VNKKMAEQKNKNTAKLLFGIIFIIAGLALNLARIGENKMFNFATVGDYLIYIGLIAIAVTALTFKKEKKFDERIILINYRATKITFSAFIIACFALIIIDGIAPINLEYKSFLSYLVCGLILLHLIAYKIIEKNS
jgi:nitrate reductase gamma subunit